MTENASFYRNGIPGHWQPPAWTLGSPSSSGDVFKSILQSAKIRSERSAAPRRCALRAQLPEIERPFAGVLGLNQPRRRGRWGAEGGGGEERKKEEEEEEVKDEAKRWVSKAREKGEREDSGEALQRRGGTGEDAGSSSCSCAHPARRVRAPPRRCRLARMRSATLWWYTGSGLILFIYSFIYFFVRLFVCLFARRKNPPVEVLRSFFIKQTWAISSLNPLRKWPFPCLHPRYPPPRLKPRSKLKFNPKCSIRPFRRGPYFFYLFSSNRSWTFCFRQHQKPHPSPPNPTPSSCELICTMATNSPWASDCDKIARARLHHLSISISLFPLSSSSPHTYCGKLPDSIECVLLKF